MHKAICVTKYMVMEIIVYRSDKNIRDSNIKLITLKHQYHLNDLPVSIPANNFDNN